MSRKVATDNILNPWSITRETPFMGLPTAACLRLLNEYFGLDGNNQKIGTITKERLIQYNRVWIHPFAYHVKGSITFECPAEDEQRAVSWDVLCDELIQEAVVMESGLNSSKYTTTAVYSTAKLHAEGHFNL